MSSSQISDVRDENACPGRTEAPIGMDLSEERELAAVITRLREALEVQQQGKRVLESLAMRKWTRDATHRKKRSATKKNHFSTNFSWLRYFLQRILVAFPSGPPLFDHLLGDEAAEPC